MIRNRHIGIALHAALVASLLGSVPLGCKSSRREVVVFAAASLARAFSELEEQLERKQGALDVRLELSGSQDACRKISELHRRADVVATADFRIIDAILRPAHARFTVRFATNEVVLAHLQHSRFTEEITADNWPTVLRRPGVRLGMAAPDRAPIGIATLLAWRLAELQLERGREGIGLVAALRAHCAPEHVVSDETEILQLLQSRAIDYAFVYRSSAEDHNLKVVLLPESINLGAASRVGDYRRAVVRARMRSGEVEAEIHGAPIVYGLSIPGHAPNPAGGALFVQHLLGEDGRSILKRRGFRPLVPAAVDRREELPVAITELTRSDR
jgi:molybdate/tungstate transport system substrate-binding protein